MSSAVPTLSVNVAGSGATTVVDVVMLWFGACDSVAAAGLAMASGRTIVVVTTMVNRLSDSNREDGELRRAAGDKR